MLFYLNHTARVDIPPTFEPILYFLRFHNFCQFKSLFQDHLKFNEQGHRNGESARLQSLWPGFDCQTNVTCGLGLLLILVLASSQGFSLGPPVFLPTSTNTNIQIPFGLGNSRQEKPRSGMSTARFPFIYLIPISIPNIFNSFLFTLPLA